MSKTYCGRECESCTYKEELKCSGCKSGPGKEFNGKCKLALCCRDKGHDMCDICSHKINCVVWNNRDDIPRERLERVLEERKVENLYRKRAPFIGKWLWLLFWVAISTEIARLMTKDVVTMWAPVFLLAGAFLLIICMFAYGIILLVLSSDSAAYKRAGILEIIIAVINSSYAVGSMKDTTVIFLTLVNMILFIIATYFEYKGHSEITQELNTSLASNWNNLWGLFIGMYVGVIIVGILTAISYILGFIITIVYAVWVLVATVLKLVYLYRTAQLFRRYAD